MGDQKKLVKARNEVFRKIGRNMLLCQSVEQKLKFINTYSNYSHDMSEASSAIKLKSETVYKQTMGQLVDEYLDIYSEKTEDSSMALPDRHVSFEVRVSGDSFSYKKKLSDFSSIIENRNNLIHHLLPSFDPESIGSCLEVEQRLDQQRLELLPEINNLKSIIKGIIIMSEKLMEILLSENEEEEEERQVKRLSLRQSRLVKLLTDIASKETRSDGWTLLSIAGRQIRQHAPEEMDNLNKMHGQKKLKAFILATELFDIYEEPTAKGGHRVLYRPNN